MKDDTSTPIGDSGASPNEFESDKPGTSARTLSEGGIEDLRAAGGVFVDAVRATRMPMVLTNPTLPGNPIVFANAAFLKLSGYSMDEVLGQQPHFMNGPDTDPKDAARFREMVRADQDEVLETVQYGKNGRRFVATVLISAFKDEAGRTAHHFMSWLDVTRRVDAEEEASDLRRVQAALQASEAKYRGLFDSIDEGFCVIEVLFDDGGKAHDYRFLEVNPAFERQTGLVDAEGKTMRSLVPDHEEQWFERYGHIALTGEAARFEDVAAALGRWYDVYAFRIDPPEEHRVAILFRDILERKRAERELAAIGDRQAFLLKLSDALRPLASAMDIQATTTRMIAEYLNVDRAMYAEVEGERGAETGTLHGQYARPAQDGASATAPFPERFTYADYGEHRMAARYGGELLVVDDIETDPEADANERANWALGGVRAAVVAPLVKGGRLVAEFGLQCTSPRAWTNEELSLVRDVAERTWAATERARVEAALRYSERHTRTLLAELQHRVRNTLAVVRSIARRTAERSASVDDLVSHFEGRLNAFSRVQSAITRSTHSGANLQTLIEDELLAVSAKEGQRLIIKGPPLLFKSRAAESISLAIHELATNSVKYGALSTMQGRVSVTWACTESDKGKRLHLNWVEQGLSETPKPAREGFGHELLKRTLPYELQAETDIQFTDDGLRFSMDMPLNSDMVTEAVDE